MSAVFPRGRHRRRSRTTPAVAVTGISALFGIGDAAFASSAQAAASPADLARLRMCESHGNYSTNTGNGYYGAYQFDQRTWRGLGLPGRPDQASPAMQDQAAAKLQSQRGWQPWPGCARKLGLSSRGSSARRTSAPRTLRAAATRSNLHNLSTHVQVRPMTDVELLPKGTVLFAPLFLGHTFTVSDDKAPRPEVAVWQRQMVRRGWDLEVDGIFGSESASVARRFATEKDLPVVTPGIVDFDVWNATWASPVT